jgi:hypothetical protein
MTFMTQLGSGMCIAAVESSADVRAAAVTTMRST